MRNNNPIPTHLRTDNLFLLIGGNPVPNWVAARLLTKSPAESQLHLVHSTKTRGIATRLAQLLEADPFNHRPPRYINVGDAADAEAIYEKVTKSVQEIGSGQIGLNYTGGTSVMAVHAYRAIENNAPKGVSAPIYTYLDASTSEMRFEKSRRLPDGFPPVLIASAQDAALTLDRLFRLVDSAHTLELGENDARLPEAASSLAHIHAARDDRFIKGWRKWIEKMRGNIKDQDLQWPNFVRPVAEALQGDLPATTTLKELCRTKILPFTETSHLLAWLEGPWLEDYVFNILYDKRDAYRLTDYARNVAGDFTLFDLEADVAVTRGYHLYFISCYSGTSKDSRKRKLMEAFIRARQFGGDEARAALVCMVDSPDLLTRHIASVFDIEGKREPDRRIRVFGRRQLPSLADHLGEWFND